MEATADSMPLRCGRHRLPRALRRRRFSGSRERRAMLGSCSTINAGKRSGTTEKGATSCLFVAAVAAAASPRATATSASTTTATGSTAGATSLASVVAAAGHQ